MSNRSETVFSTTPAISQADQIRNSMSVTNLICCPDTTALDVKALNATTSDAAAPVDADTAMSELSEAASSDYSALDSDASGQAGVSSGNSSESADPMDITEVKKESIDSNDEVTEEKGKATTVREESMDKDQSDTDADANSLDVPDAQREFMCVNDPFTRCVTGQYTKELSRKVISDHFGRNKTCTRDILSWPLFCRKHYQRATYNKTAWQLRKIQLILQQFDHIDSQYPGTTYNIQFKKSEESRLNVYSRQVASGISNADAEKNVTPGAGNQFEAPIDVLRELDQWVGKGKTLAAVKQIVDVISQMLEERDTEAIPAIEFLPMLPGKVPKTPPKAGAGKSPTTPKRGKTPKTPKSPGTPSRVSAKGCVKKTSSKA